jgi:hypothetical protein
MDKEKIIKRWDDLGLLPTNKKEPLALAYEFASTYLLTGEKQEPIENWVEVEKVGDFEEIETYVYPAIMRILDKTDIKNFTDDSIWDFVIELIISLNKFMKNIESHPDFSKVTTISPDPEAEFFAIYCDNFDAGKYFN